MQFNFFSVWKWGLDFGFSVLDIDTGREDEICRALIGFSYNKEDKELFIDLFWRYFIFNL
jgi:hypothetical protein